ncbi:TlpA family protein disulfide reductase [Niastella sp. OAS944]|uniref:TlpA family protein disulfide reductase n=1 Tax=Niastella sp. OAS944 TaxID=2664089 RepID=UPI0034863089|nr:thiol-disulfide isomerase/thioredoxin [Chitinophagaceae bacterium OAS944]
MKKFFISVVFFVLCTGGAHAQQYLGIGDKLPDSLLQQYKGKSILIDFWGIYCKSCIEAFPHLESLQQKYKDKLQVLLVTKDSPEMVNKLKARSAIVRNVSLPMIVNDKVFSNLFFFRSQPTDIWIDTSGIVRHITEGWHVNEVNIGKFVMGKELTLPLKDERIQDEIVGANVAPTDSTNGLLFLSYLTSYQQGQPAMIGKIWDKSERHQIGIKATNITLNTLFMTAFPNIEQFNNRIILEVKDPTAFQFPKDSTLWDWFIKNYHYCYELRLPPDKAKGLYSYMKEDLQRNFGYSAKVEKRKVKCIVISQTKEASSRLQTKGGAPVLEELDDETKFTLRNQNLNAFLERVKYYNETKPLPLVIDVSYKGNVDMDINCALTDLPRLKEELSAYGLSIHEEMRELNMLVIRN